MDNNDTFLNRLATYSPLGIFGFSTIAFIASLAGLLPFGDIVSQMIDQREHSGTICTSTLPNVLGGLYIFMFSCFIWVLIGWFVVHIRNRNPGFSLPAMERLHYLQSELWFSIILVILIFSVSTALSNIFFMRCDGTMLTLQENHLFTQANTWIVVFAYAMPLLALNAFAFTSVLLGFLWARQNYTAHSHNNIIFGYKATYWKMIEELTWGIGANQEEALRNMRAELLKEVMSVSPHSGYGEGTQATQLVGISGGEAMVHGMVAGKHN